MEEKKRGSKASDQPFLGFDMDAFQNRGLFANHYLKDRLPKREEWKAPAGIDESFDAILSLYNERAVHFSEKTNEPQTERDFIRPVLDVLWREDMPGDSYEVQVTIPNVDKRRQPDFAFFRTPQYRQDAEPGARL